jgi:nitroreductase
MKETIELIMARKSVRAWEPRPVPTEVKEDLLDATLRSPTAGNLMLYSILDVTDPEIKERLSHSCDEQPFIAKAPIVLVFLADWQRWMDYFALTSALAEGGPKPMEADLLLAFCDALIAAQTAVLAGEALGLGSCYVGDIMENYEEQRDLLGLPPYVFPASLLCLGYPTDQQLQRPQTPRFTREHIVHGNRYRREDAEGFGDLFRDRTAGPFLPGAENYGQHEYLRKFSSPFMAEMRRSVRKALENWQDRPAASGSDRA